MQAQLEASERANAKPEVQRDSTRLVIYIDDVGRATLTWQVIVMVGSPLGEWNYFVNARRPVSPRSAS